MRRLNRNWILPVATVLAALVCTCQAQVYSTNSIGHVQAINLAAHLKKGMTEEQVNQFMATNKLYSGIGIGDNFAWSEVFYLTDNCSLYLDYGGNDWGRYGISSLETAHIQSNQIDIIFIPLINAQPSNGKPQQHDATIGSASKSRMTKAQVLTVAKPILPLPAHESYHTQFKDGTWSVWAKPDTGFQQHSWTTVTIRDSDGQVLQVTSF